MAIYSFHCSPVGRGQKKSSAVEAAAYQARETIYDRVTGRTYSASPDKYGLCAFADILAPPDAPIWAKAKDRKEIWSQAEEIDTRINSRFAKSYILALPHELSILENQLLLKNYLNEQFVKRGLLVDYAIHVASKKGDHRNIHAHIMVSTRTITTEMGFGGKDREIDNKDFLKTFRKAWADAINSALEKAGHLKTVSHLSLEAQGSNKAPQQHQGQSATAIQRKGEEPDRLKYRKYEWGEITHSISISEAKKIIEAIPENELKKSLSTAMENKSKDQPVATDEILKPQENVSEQIEEIIEATVPTTKKQAVSLMIGEMGKSCDEKSEIIHSMKTENNEKLELKGEYTGLNKVRVKCVELYNKMKNDLQPFATFSGQIEKDVIEKKNPNKNPLSFMKGFFQGLIEGKNFIKELFSRTFLDDDENAPPPPPMNDEEKIQEGRGGRK
jgi:hypothetical protein